MPKAFTEREKALIGQRLLEQGYKQFSAHGLRKTNVEELAEAAGISKGAFYIFYESKEALFMDVVELAEDRFRQEILASVDLPGPSPRARLFAVLRKAFTLWKAIPLLQFFTRSDFELLARRVPAEKLQEHLASDQIFLKELIARCNGAGIPIQVSMEEIAGLVYTLFFTTLHENDLEQRSLTGAIDVLLELVAAFCLGEVVLQSSYPIRSTFQPDEGSEK